MADYVTAQNIAAGVPVNEPNGSVSFYDSYKPTALGWMTGIGSTNSWSIIAARAVFIMFIIYDLDA